MFDGAFQMINAYPWAYSVNFSVYHRSCVRHTSKTRLTFTTKQVSLS